MIFFDKVYAADAVDPKFNTLKTAFNDASKGGNAGSYLTLASTIINVLIWISGVLAVGFIIYSGILYITSAGDADKAKKGQQGIINGLIGVITVVLAGVTVRIITNYALLIAK